MLSKLQNECVVIPNIIQMFITQMKLYIAADFHNMFK